MTLDLKPNTYASAVKNRPDLAVNNMRYSVGSGWNIELPIHTSGIDWTKPNLPEPISLEPTTKDGFTRRLMRAVNEDASLLLTHTGSLGKTASSLVAIADKHYAGQMSMMFAEERFTERYRTLYQVPAAIMKQSVGSTALEHKIMRDGVRQLLNKYTGGLNESEAV